MHSRYCDPTNYQSSSTTVSNDKSSLKSAKLRDGASNAIDLSSAKSITTVYDNDHGDDGEACYRQPVLEVTMSTAEQRIPWMTSPQIQLVIHRCIS